MEHAQRARNLRRIKGLEGQHPSRVSDEEGRAGNGVQHPPAASGGGRHRDLTQKPVLRRGGDGVLQAIRSERRNRRAHRRSEEARRADLQRRRGDAGRGGRGRLDCGWGEERHGHQGGREGNRPEEAETGGETRKQRTRTGCGAGFHGKSSRSDSIRFSGPKPAFGFDGSMGRREPTRAHRNPFSRNCESVWYARAFPLAGETGRRHRTRFQDWRSPPCPTNPSCAPW